MSQKLQQIFQNIPVLEPKTGLKAAILVRVKREGAKRLFWKKAFFRFISVSSALATLVAMVTLGQEFVHSEFISMASLFFSDMSTVMTNWYDFSLSLLETFPTVTVSLILLPMFVTFMSLGSYLDLENHQRKSV